VTDADVSPTFPERLLCGHPTRPIHELSLVHPVGLSPR
jgi:hypothetical protein